MTKHIEQSRRHGHYDPRYADTEHIRPAALFPVPDLVGSALDETPTVETRATAEKGLVASGR